MPSRKEKFKDLLDKLGKRPRIVLEKILENGSVSTYELGQLGYDQPPRAAQDLKEAGVKLKVSFGKHPISGSRMAIYSLDPDQDLSLVSISRIAFPKSFRQELFHHHDSQCNLCNVRYETRVLQIDHRIPYIIGGEALKFNLKDFQLLCPSHQRAKSWECERCSNRSVRNISVCRTCYWAFPDKPCQHIAGTPECRVDITWKGETEIKIYRKLRNLAHRNAVDISTAIKNIVRRFLNDIK